MRLLIPTWVKTAIFTGFTGSFVLAANSAQAVILAYTNQTSFLNDIQPGYYLNDFETVSITLATPSPITFNNGTYSYQASASTSTFYGIGTSVDHWLSTNIATDSITLNNFSPTVTAIGGFFFATDFNELLTPGTINVSVNAGSSSLSTLTNSSTNFFGFISDDGTPLTSLVINTTQPGTGFVWPTSNNLIVGQAATPVPWETDTLPLIGSTVLFGLGLWGKQKLAQPRKEKKGVA